MYSTTLFDLQKKEYKQYQHIDHKMTYLIQVILGAFPP